MGNMSFGSKTRSQLGNSPKEIFAKSKSEMNSNIGINLDNNNKEISNKKNKKEKKFTLRIREAKIDKYKVGYIFMIRPYLSEKEYQEKKITSISDTILNNISENKLIYEFPEINFEKDEIYFKNIISEKDEEFTFDLKSMSYKQFNFDENKEINFYEDLKNKAIKKITDLRRQFQEEESEEEEEETISAYDIEEKLSSKKGNKR